MAIYAHLDTVYSTALPPAEIFRLCSEAAATGEACAQNDLGYCYWKAIGVANDNDEAFRLFGLAAEQDLPIALANLASCFEFGYGTTINYAEAFRLYSAAAPYHVPAKIFVAACHECGIGTPIDHDKALRGYMEHADHSMAQSFMGLFYTRQKQYDLAMHWHRKAAMNDRAASIFNMGMCYARGEGVARDEGDAVRLYRYAAPRLSDGMSSTHEFLLRRATSLL